MPNRPVIRLRPKAGRRAREGAPWIFSNEIAMDARTKALSPGTIVNVEGDDGRAFGTGYFHPNTLIAVRLFECPADTDIDEAFFAGRLRKALAMRERLYDAPYYRLVHAEGDGLPGLVVDRFDDVLVAQISTAGMEAARDAVCAALDSVLSPATILLRGDAPSRSLEGLGTYVQAVRGEPPQRLRLIENAAQYLADLAAGQKTGWYYDQRDNRAFVASLCAGKSVLDAFCYSGGFSILAARAGASGVTGIDGSTPALALAEDAAVLNGVAGRCTFVKADALEELERLSAAGETFDIVIADPPPFVRSKKDLEPGARAYRKLARLAASVTAPDGFLLLASCSHNIPMDRFAWECAIGIHRAGRHGALIRAAGASPDHPVHPLLPETAYLKALVYAVS